VRTRLIHGLRSRTLPERLLNPAKMLVRCSAEHGVEEIAAQRNVARQRGGVGWSASLPADI
jgi:hypothetical protein